VAAGPKQTQDNVHLRTGHRRAGVGQGAILDRPSPRDGCPKQDARATIRLPAGNARAWAAPTLKVRADRSPMIEPGGVAEACTP
jgi:hypothetical protein